MMYDLTNQGSPGAGAGRRAALRSDGAATAAQGFSLVELLVVVGIIILVLALAGPAFNKIMQGTNVKQGQNMVTAYLASARALALQRRCSTAVVFFEDTPNNYGGQTAVAVAYAVLVDTTNSNVSYFAPAPGRITEYLPTGVKVATIVGNTGNLNTEAIYVNGVKQSAATCRAVVFDASGRMVVRDGLGLYTVSTPGYASNPVTVLGSTYWNFTATVAGGSITSDVYSSPAVIIYDGAEFQNWINSQGSAPTNTQISTWLQAHTDVLAVNAYTGNVVR